jgi:hypothetical protein
LQFLQPPVTTSVLGPNMVLTTLLSNIPNLVRRFSRLEFNVQLRAVM